MPDNLREFNPNSLFEHAGRIGRLHFIGVKFILNLVGLTIVLVLMAASPASVVLRTLVCIPFGLLSLFATIKRLHDLDKSGWHWLWLFLPLANIVLLLILIFKKGTEGRNRFGLCEKKGKIDLMGNVEVVVADVTAVPLVTSVEDGVPIVPAIDIEGQLRKLKDLFEQGLLSEEAYKQGQAQAVERYTSKQT